MSVAKNLYFKYFFFYEYVMKTVQYGLLFTTIKRTNRVPQF